MPRQQMQIISAMQLEKNAKAAGESIELDDDGKVKGWDDKLNALKVQCPNMFESGEGGKNIHENKLPDQNQGGGATDPKNLADAIRMKFEENKKGLKGENYGYDIGGNESRYV